MSLINRLLKILYGCLFFFTPLIVLPITSELFEFNKMLFIYLMTVLVSFFWLLKVIFTIATAKQNVIPAKAGIQEISLDSRFRGNDKNNISFCVGYKFFIIKNLFNICLIIFFITQVISSIFSIDTHTSFFGYYGRFNGGLFSITSYIILYFIFISSFEKEFVFKLLKISLLSSFLVILWGLPGKVGFDLSCLVFTGQFNNNCWTNQFHPDIRMFSTLGQPNWLGAYLAVNFFIGLYFFIKKTWKPAFAKVTFLYFLYLILNFTVILFTRSRSALLSVVVGLGLFFFYIIFFQKDKLKKLLILFLFLLISTLVFKTGIDKLDRFFNLNTYLVKLTLQNDKLITKTQKEKEPQFSSEITESFDIRKIVWKGAINLGLKYPLFGTGVETFAYSYYFERPREHNLTSEWDYLYNKAHNEYLNYLATTGFLGLISYLTVIVSFIIYALKILNIKYQILNIHIKNEKDENSQITNNQLLITCLLISYFTILITNFFGFSTTTINLFFYLIPAFVNVIPAEAGIHLIDSRFRGNYKSDSKKLSLKQEFLIIFNGLITIYLLVSITSYFLADIKYSEADNYFKADGYQKTAQLLSEALKLRYEHVYEDKLSYSLANLGFNASYQKQKDVSEKLIKLAKFYNDHSLEAAPMNVLYWKTKAKNSYLFYQSTLDSKYLKEGLQALAQAKKLSSTDPKIDYSIAIYYSLLADETKNTVEKKSLELLSLKSINEALNLKPDLPDLIELKKQLEAKYKVTK